MNRKRNCRPVGDRAAGSGSVETTDEQSTKPTDPEKQAPDPKQVRARSRRLEGKKRHRRSAVRQARQHNRAQFWGAP